MINFAKEGTTPYGYIVGPIDPATGIPSSVRFKSSDGSETRPKFPGSKEYEEAKEIGGW